MTEIRNLLTTESLAELVSVHHRTASTSITGWPTTGLAWHAFTCRISCPWEES